MGCSVTTLTRNMVNNCKPNGQGLYENMFSIRLPDILAAAVDSAGVITGFTLKSGAKFKLWQGRKLSHKRGTGFASNDNGNKTPHTVTVAFFDNSPEADMEINSIKDMVDLVIISKQNGANGRWKVSGYPTGLACSGLSEDSNSADLPGVYVLDFAADQADKLAPTFKHVTSSLEDTEAYLITLTETIA